MSKSREITQYKRRIISDIINSETIVSAINEQGVTIDNSSDLVELCIFDYNRIPDVQEVARTYITVQVNIPRIEKGNIFRETITVIRVITHIDKMNLSGGRGNSIDYISAELDDLLSGREDFGYGRMLITSNSEGAITSSFMARTMTFTSTNNNMSFCGN